MVDALVVERSHWRQGTGAALMGVAESWGSALVWHRRLARAAALLDELVDEG